MFHTVFITSFILVYNWFYTGLIGFIRLYNCLYKFHTRFNWFYSGFITGQLLVESSNSSCQLPP